MILKISASGGIFSCILLREIFGFGNFRIRIRCVQLSKLQVGAGSPFLRRIRCDQLSKRVLQQGSRFQLNLNKCLRCFLFTGVLQAMQLQLVSAGTREVLPVHRVLQVDAIPPDSTETPGVLPVPRASCARGGGRYISFSLQLFLTELN